MFNGIPSIPSDSYLTSNFIKSWSSNDSTCTNTDNNNANQTESSNTNTNTNDNRSDHFNRDETIANLPRFDLNENSLNGNDNVQTVKESGSINMSIEQKKQQLQTLHAESIDIVTDCGMQTPNASSLSIQLQVKQSKSVQVDCGASIQNRPSSTGMICPSGIFHGFGTGR